MTKKYRIEVTSPLTTLLNEILIFESEVFDSETVEQLESKGYDIRKVEELDAETG